MNQDELVALPDVTPQIVGHELSPGVVVPRVDGGFTGVLWQEAGDGDYQFKGDWYETGWHKGIHVKRRTSYRSHA